MSQLDALTEIEKLRRSFALGEGRSTEFAGHIKELGALEQQLRPDPTLEGVVPGGRDTLGGDDHLDLQVSQVASHLPVSAVIGLERTGRTLAELKLGPGQSRTRQKLCIRYQIPEYSIEEARTVILSKEEVMLQLLPALNRRCSGLTSPTRASLRVEVERLEAERKELRPGLIYLQTHPFWLLPPSTAVTSLTAEPRIDMRDSLVCWVTPSAPEVLNALRGASEAGAGVQEFTGYAGSPEGVALRVRKQVETVFNYLKKLPLHYISSDLTIAGPGTVVQRVRSPRESLELKSANCIDGTVLYASMLLAAGIEPALVLMPGHALLGWRRNRGERDWSFLETTSTRALEFDAACKQADQLADQVGGSLKIVDVRERQAAGYYPAF